MICKKCGNKIPEDGRLCPYCGAPVIRSSMSGDSLKHSYQQQTSVNQKNPKMTVCPFCKHEVTDGDFCSKCSKPLHPKWYQKNSTLTIGLMIAAFAFCAFCVYLAISMGL